MYLDNIDMNINLYVSVELLRIDNLTNIIKSIICISTGIILIMSEEIIKRLNMKEIEYSIIVNIATLGLLMIISANELIILYLGIEIYSLSFYVLTAINK
jgi:NADH-quinone oxidoreductase subunit N